MWALLPGVNPDDNASRRLDRRSRNHADGLCRRVSVICLTVSAWLMLLLGHVGNTLAQPNLRSIRPLAVQRGATTTIRGNGERLSGASQLLCYSGDLVTEHWSDRDEGRRVSFQLTPAVDFPIGWHALRLCTPEGVTNVVMIYVTDEEPIFEQDALHAADQPQEIPFGSLLLGTLRMRDIDAYAFEVEAGARISIEVQGLRAGRAMYDPQLVLLGPDGELLAECDDTTVTRQDPFLSLIAPVSGRYVAIVTESQYSGNSGFWYLLHVGDFPRPTSLAPAGGAPGNTLKLTWLNGEGRMFDQDVQLPNRECEEFAIWPQDQQGIAPSPIPIRIHDLPVVVEVEPNNRAAEAQSVTVPVAIHGVIQEPGDDDLFRISATQGQTLEIRVYARWPSRSPLDSVIAIRNAENQHLVSNDDAHGRPDSFLQYTFPEDGDYIVLIRDQRGRGQPDMTYRLEISPPRTQLKLRSPDFRVRVTPTVSIPAQNRMALLIHAERQHASGPVELELSDQPAELQAVSPTILAERYQVPVLFEAGEPTATPVGSLVRVTGTLREADTACTGILELRQVLVAGRNNVEMLGITLDRLATVITDAVPLQIELISPAAPLPRTGTKQLQVRAIREAGFSGPVTVRMLYNPPGVSAQGQATIAADTDIAELTLTANDSAQLGSWPLVMVGEAIFEGRHFEIATQIAHLEVADQYFSVELPRGKIVAGDSSEYRVSLQHRESFAGTGTAELLGLPPGVTSTKVEFTNESDSLWFALTAASHARQGRFDGISCRLTIEQQNEPVVHVLGRGTLRVEASNSNGTVDQNQSSQSP